MRAAFSPVVGIIEIEFVHPGPPAASLGLDDQNLDQTLARLVAECTTPAPFPARPSVCQWRMPRRRLSQPIGTPVETIVAHRSRLAEELAHETRTLLAQFDAQAGA